MSLDGFYHGVAALAADPDLVRRCRGGDRGWLASYDLTDPETERLVTMAQADGMEVLCTLYRSSRLTALVGVIPTVVEALGERLNDTATAFWRQVPRSDMQFRTECLGFCGFVRERFPGDEALRAVVADAERSVVGHYDRSGPGPPGRGLFAGPGPAPGPGPVRRAETSTPGRDQLPGPVPVRRPAMRPQSSQMARNR